MRRGSHLEKTRRQSGLKKFNQATVFLGVLGVFVTWPRRVLSSKCLHLLKRDEKQL